MKKTSTIVIIILVLLVIIGGLYWYFLMGPNVAAPGDQTNPGGFNPFGGSRPGPGGQNATTTGPGGQNTEPGTSTQTPGALPTLRLLSSSPVGGYGTMASTTTTVVRWADRGRGNIYEADYKSPVITTLSNTVVPRLYESSWNKDVTAFIGSLFQESEPAPTTVYAELIRRSVSTATTSSDGTSLTPYSLRGKNVSGDLIAYASSPDKSRLFMLINENGNGVGYVSSFSGQNTVKIFTTPLTQINAEWPADNIIAITTKGSASYPGYLYFVSPKTGVWTKMLGPLGGLSAKVSRDGKHILASANTKGAVATRIYTVTPFSSEDAVIRTLADKCAWGNLYKDMVYCGVPTEIVSGTYPDGWYMGKTGFVDKVWQVNAITQEVHLVSSLIDQADRVIDAFNLSLDPKDDYLFFMNKNDLSLWSLDLAK